MYTDVLNRDGFTKIANFMILGQGCYSVLHTLKKIFNTLKNVKNNFALIAFIFVFLKGSLKILILKKHNSFDLKPHGVLI